MSRDTFVLKAQINAKTSYLKLQWTQNDVDLFNLQILCDDGKSWSGTYSNELAQKYMNQLFQNKDNYYTNTKKCLAGEREGSEFKLDLLISDDSDTAQFSWKKRFEDIYQVQGSLTLTKDNSVSEHALIDFLIDENKELRTVVANIDRHNEELNAEIVKYKSELEKFVDVKTSVEKSLYGKFIQLLNTKKQRIQSLEEQLLCMNKAD